MVAKFGSTALNDRGLPGDRSTSVVAKLGVSGARTVMSVSVAGGWLLCTRSRSTGPVLRTVICWLLVSRTSLRSVDRTVLLI